jgi:hypothetical protein
MSVRAKINMSNSADASHAAARSEHRTTIFSEFEPRGRERGTYEWRCYVRLKCEKKVEKGVVIMAMNVRIF